MLNEFIYFFPPISIPLKDDLPLMLECYIRYFLTQTGEELCWVFVDDEGRRRGPHSLSELYTWHHYGYLRDSLTVSCLSSAVMVICTNWGLNHIG